MSASTDGPAARPADYRARSDAVAQVYRPIDDPKYVAVDLEFDSQAEAEAFKLGLEAMWRSPQAALVLGGNPRARIVDTVETRVH